MEDTYNLLGHALRKALSVIARQQGWGLADIAKEAGAQIVAASSLKAALDLDWDDPEQRQGGLVRVLAALDNVQGWLEAHPRQGDDPDVAEGLAAANQVREQDVEVGEDGALRLRVGVAWDRRISVEDAQMRHGHKSRRQLFDGYKRHVLRDLDNGLVRAVAVTMANVPEATATDAIMADLASQDVTLVELDIDRAYLSSHLVRERPEGLQINCKAWPVRNGIHFPKTAFAIDWEQGLLTCPNQVSVPFQPGGVLHFPKATCAACCLRERCTSSRKGRSVTIICSN